MNLEKIWDSLLPNSRAEVLRGWVGVHQVPSCWVGGSHWGSSLAAVEVSDSWVGVAYTILATHGWQQSESPSFAYSALDSVCQRFSVPLEKANINLSLVQEWDDMLEYSKRYLNLVQEDYKMIWWKLFNSIDANKWTNILAIVDLLFCLPSWTSLLPAKTDQKLSTNLPSGGYSGSVT